MCATVCRTQEDLPGRIRGIRRLPPPAPRFASGAGGRTGTDGADWCEKSTECRLLIYKASPCGLEKLSIFYIRGLVNQEFT